MAGLLRLGAANGVVTNKTAEEALFQQEYTLDVITAFDEANVMSPLVNSRTITNAKSAVFPVSWKTDAMYWKPGDTDLGGNQTVNLNEIVIGVDRELISDVLIPNIDTLMAYWDVRSEVARQQGLAISRKYDKHLLQKMVLASRSTAARVTGAETADNKVAVDKMGTDASVLGAGIFSAVAKLAANDVPIDQINDLACVLRPAQYFLLSQATAYVNRDYSGAGSVATGRCTHIAGVPLYMSNHLPITDLSADTGDLDEDSVEGPVSTYRADFALTRGIVFHRTALATVKLYDLTFESEYLIQKQASLFVAKMACGTGIVRSEAAVELAEDN